MKGVEHNVGTRVSIPLPLWVKGSAVFAGERNEYRPRLYREWDTSRPCILWIMMNPSAADATADDRSVFRCRTFSESWGYGRMWVGNIHSYRCTDQKRLLETLDPVGPDNDKHLLAMAAESSLIVMAYGNRIPHCALAVLRSLLCFARTVMLCTF